MTPAELAQQTGCGERYAREWLSAQAAGGYCEYDAAAGRFFLSEERAFALATENSPAFLPGAFQVVTASIKQLRSGAKVADVGRGHGAYTILVAQEYPRSTFIGFDYHEASIEWARSAAKKAGVTDRESFEVSTAKKYPGSDYDLVAFFDCLHDMGDPVGASAHIKSTLGAGGTFMLVEPFAHDKLEQNLNPVGRLFYGASTLLCTPASLAQ